METKQEADVARQKPAQGDQCKNSKQVCFCFTSTNFCCPTEDCRWTQLWLLQNDKLVKCCCFMQKHHERISVVLSCVAALHLLDYTSVEKKTPRTHLLDVQQHTRVGKIHTAAAGAGTRGLHCAFGTWLYLRLLPPVLVFTNFTLHNMNGNEAPHGRGHKSLL